MSTTLERQTRKFQNQACLKSTAYYPVLGPALQGTTSTLPALGSAYPGTWKAALSAPTITKLNNLWTALDILRTQVSELGLHYHPAELASTITTNADTNAGTDIADFTTYLKPGFDLLERKDIQLAKGVRLKNPAGAEVCGGTPMDNLENGEVPQEADDVYIAVDFTGLLSDATIEGWLTAMSSLVAQNLAALAANNLLQTS